MHHISRQAQFRRSINKHELGHLKIATLLSAGSLVPTIMKELQVSRVAFYTVKKAMKDEEDFAVTRKCERHNSVIIKRNLNIIPKGFVEKSIDVLEEAG